MRPARSHVAKKMTKLKPFLFFLAVIVLTSPLLLGQGLSQNFGFGILPFQSLNISGLDAQSTGSVSTIAFPEASLEDLERGYIEKQEIVEMTLESNVPWSLSFYTNDETMGTSHDGTYTKPIQHFQVRVDGGSYIDLSNINQEFLFGSPTKTSFSIDYRMLLDRENHSPGNYQASVTYTLSSR